MRKVLLLNPPGKNIYIRDYYCSKTSQANYIYHPIDLVILSGFLRDKYEVKVIDAIVEKISPDTCLKKIAEFNPDVIVFLTGAVSWYEDIKFLKRVYESSKSIKFIGSGDILREDFEKRFQEARFLYAILLDFTADDVLKIIDGFTTQLRYSVVKENGGVKVYSNIEIKKEFEIPLPQHELFICKKYRYPFVRGKNFATVLTEYGCPFKCSFCIIGAIGYKYRSPQNVVDELVYLKDLGISEVFFATQTFGAYKEYSKKLCDLIKPLALKWFTFSRVDVVDEELLRKMKDSGCHTIIFGIESGSEEILKKYRKGYTKEQIRSTLEICTKLGIDTVGTFILGLPSETKKTINETMEFLKQLPLDYASFNVAAPRVGTELRKEAISSGLIDENFDLMDQSTISMNTCELTKEEILRYRREFVREFYFNPSYIWRRIKKINSVYSFFRQINEAIGLIKQTWSTKIQ